MAEVHRVHRVAIVVDVAVDVVVDAVDSHVHVVPEAGWIGHLIAEERVLRIGVKAHIASVRRADVVAIVVHEMIGEGVRCLELLLWRQSHWLSLSWLHLRVVLAGLGCE